MHAAAGTCRKIKKRHGRLTIAVGRNLNDRGLADDEIDYLFANDLVIAGQIFANSNPHWDRLRPYDLPHLDNQFRGKKSKAILAA